MTTTQLAASRVDDFDYVIVGGGTAGCVIASRLASYLPDKKILLIEAGPSDYQDDRVLKLREWLSLLGGELDYDYGTTEQPNGKYSPFSKFNSPLPNATPARLFNRLIDQLRNRFQPVHPRHRNQVCKDWIQSCSSALEIPIITDFNKEITSQGGLKQGVGFFSVAYNPEDSRRSSASVAYLHPTIRGEEKRPNLTTLVEAWVSKVNAEGDVVTGVNVSLKSGEKLRVRAKKEVVLSAGAVDTPRLLLLSGIGPKKQLEDLGIPVVKDIPGVGENLLDHPESIIMWELNKPMPQESTMDSDAGIFLRREANDARGGDGKFADIMMHCYQIPFCLNTARLGYEAPLQAFCMTPNIPRPRSRGRMYLTSADPTIKPALNFRYFTDPEGYDATTIVAGLKAARKVALREPFKSWLKREVAPGPNLQTDEELSEYGRRVAHTVYHPAGTTKMGDPKWDPMVVVDWRLRVTGFSGCRVADAGVFPEMPSINPMLTVLAIGERAAEMIAEDVGWKARL